MPVRPLFTAIGAALTMAWLPIPPAHAAGWVTGPPLSEQPASSPMVAVTPSGERIVAWVSQSKTTPNTTEGIDIRVAAPGQDFGPIQLIGTNSVSDAKLVVGADGTAAIAWRGNDAVHVARRAAGAAAFTEATALPAPGIDSLDATVDGGAVDVAYSTNVNSGAGTVTNTTTIRVARLAAGATAVAAVPGAAAPTLDTASFVINTFIADEVAEPSITADGGAVQVIWEHLKERATATVPSVTTVVRATLAPGAAAFGAAVTVDTISVNSFSPDDVTPRIVATAGRVDAAWTRQTAGQVAYEGVVPASPIQTISTGAQSVPFGAQAGLDGAGALNLAWVSTIPTVFTEAVSGAVAPGAGPVATPPPLTPATSNRLLEDLAVAPDGAAVLLADLRTDNPFGSQPTDLKASFHAPGAPFGAVEDVTGAQDRTGLGAFDSASAAVGPDDRAVAAWTADDRSGTDNNRIFFSQRDATPPVFGTVAIPTTAAPATPVALAASATDDLTAATIGWDFGDGSQATGPSVTHAYGAPGTYPVTVTATDASGNVATRTATIGVAAASGPGPDHTAPSIANLRVTNARFKVAGSATAVIARHRRAAKKAPTGTAFKLTLSERATLVIDVTGKAHREVGAVIRGGRGAGAVSIPFTGRIGATRLAPGSYTASVTAIDAAGNRSRPRTVRFTVVTR